MATDKSLKSVSRQNIRKILLIISFLLIPVTIFYVSPIVIMMGAAEGIASGSMLLFILLFILSLFVGRLWCGWLCPMGAWQEICSPLMKHTVIGGWRDWIKYGVTVLWLGVIGLSMFSAGGIHAVDPFYGTVGGISISSLEVLMMVALIFFIIFIVAFFTGRRGFCHVLCPIAGIIVAGRLIRNLAGWPALQLNAAANQCIDCNKCKNECPMGLDVHRMVRAGNMEDPDCILCANCSDTCPKGVIRYSVARK
ncbi:MAG: 4Fe-4S binding protein [Methanospirillum sp.]|uniref:4Fe-4S binding protein n=1 Tax=Methanospirillum sp. TaxID=45200 RepID=UPI00236EE061|nr:4Fe-4S binding protein [Methanospirillum sp.]MDD1729126.1 4Fe-4S binding protein [Methanospirillum sp.]